VLCTQKGGRKQNSGFEIPREKKKGRSNSAKKESPSRSGTGRKKKRALSQKNRGRKESPGWGEEKKTPLEVKETGAVPKSGDRKKKGGKRGFSQGAKKDARHSRKERGAHQNGGYG